MSQNMMHTGRAVFIYGKLAFDMAKHFWRLQRPRREMGGGAATLRTSICCVRLMIRPVADLV